MILSRVKDGDAGPVVIASARTPEIAGRIAAEHNAELARRKAVAEGALIEGELVTEHATQMHTGRLVRHDDAGTEGAYPLAEWLEDRDRDGVKVFRRRVVVLEDWAQVPG